MQSLLALAVLALLPTRTQWYGFFFIIDAFRIYDFRRCRNHSVLIVKKSKHSDSYRKLCQLMPTHPRTNPRFLHYSMSFGTLNSRQDHSVLGTWQAAATSKNPFTILKRFLQIRPYSYEKFSLLSDSLEFDLNTFTLNYYLAFKGFWQ